MIIKLSGNISVTQIRLLAQQIVAKHYTFVADMIVIRGKDILNLSFRLSAEITSFDIIVSHCYQSLKIICVRLPCR
jgi:hypothetical protein